MTIYLGLEDFVETAAAVLDLPEETVVKMARLDLAESALHAPQAGWGEVEFYPDLPMKAAVLLVRLAKNHALYPDKLAALAERLSGAYLRAEARTSADTETAHRRDTGPCRGGQEAKPQVSDLRFVVEVGRLELPSRGVVPGLLRAQPPVEIRTRASGGDAPGS